HRLCESKSHPSDSHRSGVAAIFRGALPINLDSDQGRELVADLCRFAENILDEKFIRRKYRLPESVWKNLGEDDALLEKIEAEKIRRMRDGSSKRELAQKHIMRGPTVLGAIMDDTNASPRHRVDAIKTLDGLATNGPESAAAADRFQIVINIGNESLRFDKSR